MALFSERPTEKLFGGDTATRALSSAAVENAFVERVYEKLAGVYDLTFGPTLHPGRLQALDRMAIADGKSVLEVGVGTGINLGLYPRACQITGIDLSSGMLERPASASPRRGCAIAGSWKWTPRR
jgi:phosphatidylethanolamine/phosphatidyl-N-methylethanolamine N-methyltransferase